MNIHSETKNYFFDHYKEIMSLYSHMYTQVEIRDNSSIIKLSAKASYYTVVSYSLLRKEHSYSFIESFIKSNKEKNLDIFEQELMHLILFESKLHDLEVKKLLKIKRDKTGITKISLIKTGKSISIRNIEDISDFL